MSGSGRVPRKANLPAFPPEADLQGGRSRRPRWRTTHGGGTRTQGTRWHPRRQPDLRRSRALLRRQPPVRVDSGGVAPLPEGPATANRRASAVGRAAAPDGAPDREPVLPIRRRSAGPIDGDFSGVTLRWRSRERLEQRSPGSVTGSASRFRRGRCCPQPRLPLPLPPGPFPDRSGISLIQSTGRCRLSAQPVAVRPVGVPVVGRATRSLPASAPAGTDLRPNLAVEVSRCGIPRPRPVDVRSGAAPRRAAGPGIPNGDEPRSWFGLQALACGEVGGRAAFAGR